MAPLPTPEEKFGFQPGADRKLIRWPAMLEYFQEIADSSDRIIYEEMGLATEGQPMVMLKISSPENLARLDRIKEIQGKLADPRDLTEDEAESLIDESVAVVLITCSVHATEVGSVQMTPELVHEIDADGTLGVSYNGLIAPMIEAIKELKLENEMLRARLDALEKQEQAGKQGYGSARIQK